MYDNLLITTLPNVCIVCILCVYYVYIMFVLYVYYCIHTKFSFFSVVFCFAACIDSITFYLSAPSRGTPAATCRRIPCPTEHRPECRTVLRVLVPWRASRHRAHLHRRVLTSVHPVSSHATQANCPSAGQCSSREKTPNAF